MLRLRDDGPYALSPKLYAHPQKYKSGDKPGRWEQAMLRGSAALRVLVIVAVYMTVLGLLRYKPWRAARAAGTGPQMVAGADREVLKIGFLPVT